MYLGCHLSSSGGFLAMGETACSIGADTFQFFTRNPRGGAAKPIDPEDAAALVRLLKEKKFGPLVAHAPYTLNPCAAEAKIRDFALMAFQDDLKRMEFVPGNLYNFHPGSHVGQGIEQGIRWIIELLDKVLTKEQTTTVLLETMSGKGSEVGSCFEELAEIMHGVSLGSRMGVCLDTCHVYSAGYDIVNDPDGVLKEFDRIIGLDKLKAVHLNDSMMAFSSHKDRHEKIGKGSLGLEAIVKFITHPALRHLPFVLETPCELPEYAEEIALLRKEMR